jgi:hypothetical protein
MPFSHLGEGSVFIAPDPESEDVAVFVKTGEVAVRFMYAGIKLPNSIKVRGSMFDEPVAKYCALQPSAEVVFKRSASVRIGHLDEVHVLEYQPPPPPSGLPGHPLFEDLCMDG